MMRAAPRALLLGAAFVAGTVQAVEYTDPRPLVDQMDPTIQSCRQQDELRVPLRSSGVDLVPLYANNYQLDGADNGIFAKNELDVTLQLQNDIRRQVRDYLSCEVPIMRATQGMLNTVADLTEADERTRMVALYQHGFSNGADALVSRDSIRSTSDLSGATIVTQAFGPHLNYMHRIIRDARESAADDGESWKEPSILYTDDLMGLSGNTPGAALLEDRSIDAAFVTTADAQVLTSGGKVGTGAEGSVKGAEITLSTKSANRLISEVYVVRADYLEKNRDQVRRFVKALFNAEEKVREDVVKQVIDWEAVASILLNDSGATDDAADLWRGVETVGLQGNIDWATPDSPRSWKQVNDEIQNALVNQGLMSSAYAFQSAEWDYQSFAGNVFDQRRTELPGFDNNKASSVVDSMKKSGDLEGKALMKFEIGFEPNQKEFSARDYSEKFDKVLETAASYNGAVITVEGHSDPLNYLKKKHNGASSHQLKSIRQASRNLSMSRAMEVRDTVLAYAEEQDQAMDESQFVTLGHGINEPRTGMCGGDPCPPETEAEWRSNMRVVFRIVNVEAESSTFTPSNAW